MFADREKNEAAVRSRISVADAGYDRPSMFDPPRPLRYTSSPLGQHTADRSRIGGITSAENAVVRDLSHGRVDLHAIGASVHHVAETHPRLAAVGARSLTQGRQALIGDPADRGHEIWHLAQQAMGEVRPTTIIGGASVNTDARLEADADRMGAAITRATGHANPSSMVAHTTPVPNTDGLIQRQITKFKSQSVMREPPIPYLLKVLDYSKFQESKTTVQKTILNQTKNPKARAAPTPKSIEATIAPNSSGQVNPKRLSHKSAVVGNIGTDYYYLETGHNADFEGGHLIPHELWTTSDPQAHLADDYVNLVPMSRFLNTGFDNNTWKNNEDKITSHWKNGKAMTVKIDITTPSHKYYTYENLARVFKLTLKDSKYSQSTVGIWNWIPEKIVPTDVTNTISFDTTYENASHMLHGEILTGGELVGILRTTPIWNRCHPDLQDDLLDL